MYLLALSLTALFFFGPFCVLGILGYKYGYRQEITKLGIAMRVLFWCLLLSWSIISIRGFHVSVAYPLPSVLCVYFAIVNSDPGITFLPPAWVAPSAQIIFYLLSVVHGYRTRERTYVPFPKSGA